MNMTKYSAAILPILLTFTLQACDKGKAPTTAKPAAAPEIVSFTKAALYPEGVDYDTQGKRFLVTSLHEGIVGAVTDDGSYSVFAQDPSMVSAIGIRIDAARDRVLVCNSDPGASIHTKKENQGKLAGLAAFQLSTGKLIKYVDLGKVGGAGGHFCNDLIIDSNGTAYVTDSFSPIIYKVDATYNATVFLNNKRFTGESFNLNGLVMKDDYLIVAKMNEGLLFKVPLAHPEKFSQVKIKESLAGADGLLWGPDGSLVVIANGNTNKVFKLTSSDNWASATVAGSVDTGDVFATTGVVRDGKIYVLYARLNILFNPATKTHVDKFEIRQQKL
jgi:sugar lactone lactonase YvrE